MTHDSEFEKWANKVWNYGAALKSEVSLKDFRRNIVIDLLNEAGQVVMAYKVYRCWVSEWQAWADMDANANDESRPKPTAEQSAQTLVDKFHASAKGSRASGILPVRINVPAVGPWLFLVSELSTENQSPSAEFSYQLDKKAGGK